MTAENKQIIIAPSILSGSFGNLAAEIQDVDRAGADWIHIDVMDGSFVPPITFGDNMVALARKTTQLTLDTHLMIQKPENHFETFKNAGSDRVTFHAEASSDPNLALKKIRALGMKSGVSIRPETPLKTIEPYLENADLVLIMTVNPGWSGQRFMPECLSKIERLRSIIEQRNLNTLIQVDGGINKETASLSVRAGANILVAGSFVFGAKDRKEIIAALKVCG